MSSATYSSIQTYSPSQTSTPSVSYSESLSHSFTPDLSFSSYSTQVPSPTFTSCPSQSPISTFTVYSSPTQTCRLVSLPTTSSTVLSNISDNTFYAVITAVGFIFLINIMVSVHYYTEYTNEKTKRKVFDPVHQNPYHANVRDTFSRV